MMASVDFMKLKTVQDVAAQIRHDDKEERLKSDHANEDINKSLTSRNIQFKDSNYDKTLDKYIRTLAKLDANPYANKRKDRVTAFSLYVPIVPDLDPKDGAKYREIVRNCIKETYPEAVILNNYWHYDEIHEYTDATTNERRKSLAHGHVLVMPIVDGKLNAKAFSSRTNMIKLNNAIHKAVFDEFGISFMDGTGKKSKDTVEDLKAKSKKAELKVREELVKDREISVKNRENAVEIREKAVDRREKMVGDKETIYDNMIEELNTLKSSLSPEDAKRVDDMALSHKNKRKMLEEKYKGDLEEGSYITKGAAEYANDNGVISDQSQSESNNLSKYFPGM